MKTREEKRIEAEGRQAEYDKLTTEQRLARPNLGAKERAKLERRLKNPPKAARK